MTALLVLLIKLSFVVHAAEVVVPEVTDESSRQVPLLPKPFGDKKVSDYVSQPLLANGADPLSKSMVSIGFMTGDQDFYSNGFILPKNSYRHMCTGTVVGKKTVLTAAHCNFADLVTGDYLPVYAKKNFEGLSKFLETTYGVRIVAIVDSDTSTTAGKKIIQLTHFDRDPRQFPVGEMSSAKSDNAFFTLSEDAGVPAIKIAPANTFINATSELRTYGYMFNTKNDGKLQRLDSKFNEDLASFYVKLYNDDNGTKLKNITDVNRRENLSITPVAKGMVTCPGSSGGARMMKINGEWQIIGIVSGGGTSLGADVCGIKPPLTQAQMDKVSNSTIQQSFGQQFQIEMDNNLTSSPWVYKYLRGLK